MESMDYECKKRRLCYSRERTVRSLGYPPSTTFPRPWVQHTSWWGAAKGSSLLTIARPKASCSETVRARLAGACQSRFVPCRVCVRRWNAAAEYQNNQVCSRACAILLRKKIGLRTRLSRLTFQILSREVKTQTRSHHPMNIVVGVKSNPYALR